MSSGRPQWTAAADLMLRRYSANSIPRPLCHRFKTNNYNVRTHYGRAIMIAREPHKSLTCTNASKVQMGTRRTNKIVKIFRRRKSEQCFQNIESSLAPHKKCLCSETRAFWCPIVKWLSLPLAEFSRCIFDSFSAHSHACMKIVLNQEQTPRIIFRGKHSTEISCDLSKTYAQECTRASSNYVKLKYWVKFQISLDK